MFWGREAVTFGGIAMIAGEDQVPEVVAVDVRPGNVSTSRTVFSRVAGRAG